MTDREKIDLLMKAVDLMHPVLNRLVGVYADHRPGCVAGETTCSCGFNDLLKEFIDSVNVMRLSLVQDDVNTNC